MIRGALRTKKHEQPAPTPETAVRKARLSDVGALHRIINSYAGKQLMLPKTHLELYENLRDYAVVVDPSDAVLGCGALHIYWENLAEIRAMAVDSGATHRGLGSQVVQALLQEARSIGIAQVFLFTYVPEFFARFGFVRTEHRALPLKVFNDCFHCPKFNTCDEIAMVLQL
jgi:amino-acid N-acetyltransferase